MGLLLEALAIVCGSSVIIYALYQNHRVISELRRYHDKQTQEHRLTISAALTAAGVRPHNADPERFAPSGEAWTAPEKQAVQMRSYEDLERERYAQEQARLTEEYDRWQEEEIKKAT